MQSLILRALGGLLAVGVVSGVAVAPAAAAGTRTFRLAAGGVVGYGTYERRDNPEQSVPPIRVAGTLIGRSWFGCAVIQVARSGPADGIEWRTVGRQCGHGRRKFDVQTSFLFRAVEPPVRLCSGRTVSQAERGRQCDQYQPTTDH